MDYSLLHGFVIGHRSRGTFWIRVSGRGFGVYDRRVHTPYSERSGRVPAVRVSHWSVKFFA